MTTHSTASKIDTDPLASSPARAVRIGSVSYLNARPLVEGLEKCRDVELSFEVPSQLLDSLLEDRTDLALAPIVDALLSPEPIAVAPVGCIASDGPTRSVKLFSRVPMENITSVTTDPDSKTSVALARVLLSRVYSCTPSIERSATTITNTDSIEADAILMIGDKVERTPPDAEQFPHTLDLGQAWGEWTGLPFVYAAWVCLASRVDDPIIDPIITRGLDLLDHQRRRNSVRVQWIAASRAKEHGWGADEALVYLRDTIITKFGERQKQAVERFAVEAVAAGVAPAGASIRWAK
jgi:chorismate dehydratase